MKQDGPLQRRERWLLFGAIFLISLSLIAFEITLSRFLSVLLSYHYVFFILSLALLGLGLGGMFIHMIRPQIPREEKRFRVLALWASLFSISIPVSILLITDVGYIHTNFVLGGVPSLAAALLAMGKRGKGYKELLFPLICFLISLTWVGVTLTGV